MPTKTKTTPSVLPPFDGLPVLSAGVEIRNAAGGLNQAMGIDPAAYHKDEEIVVAIRCKVRDIDHRPIKDAEGWRRVHVLDGQDATIIDSEVVETALDEQARRIEEASGVHRLPLELQAAHDAGDHADELVDGCPSCDDERDAES